MFFIKKVLLLASLCCFLSQPGLASSILEVSIQQLTNEAESVFEGEVVATTPEMNNDGNIYTYVDFLVLDVLSGNLNVGETITLRFTGGTVNGLTLDMGSIIPGTGEHGVYFIESNNTPLVNPLYGWSQGHYRILTNGNIIAGNNQVVVKVDSTDYNTQSAKLKLSTGIANGITTLPQQKVNTVPLSPPISLHEFKTLIKDIKQ